MFMSHFQRSENGFCFFLSYGFTISYDMSSLQDYVMLSHNPTVLIIKKPQVQPYFVYLNEIQFPAPDSAL